MATLLGDEVRRRFNERYNYTDDISKGGTYKGFVDAAFFNESQRLGYKGGAIDEGQLNAYFESPEAQSVQQQARSQSEQMLKSSDAYRYQTQASSPPASVPAANPGSGGSGGGGGVAPASAMSGLQQSFKKQPPQESQAPQIADQGMPSPTNPMLGQRNLPMQGLRLALMRGRIY